MDIELLAINTIRTLSMDGVQKAESGHPGTPMALAPLAYRLFTKHMKHDPSDPKWFDRDRFILSCGHASMLLYSTLHLTGYGLSLEDLKQFRQWESKTPGHPEHDMTPGVETTTGPLGAGISNAVGFAMAEAHLAATFNKPGNEIINHHTWFICSDGDLMEGVSHEAASFAGHNGLGKLIGFYDDNRITIDGATDLSFSEDAEKRFGGYGWQVLRLDDVNDLAAIDKVVFQALADTSRPTLVITRTHIGFGSPNKVDSHKAHGEPLGKDEIVLTKKNLGWPWPEESFRVPPEVLQHCQQYVTANSKRRADWQKSIDAHPSAAELKRRIANKLPSGWESKIPTFTKETGGVASRAASNVVLNALIPALPELVGGSADLTPSNGTALKGQSAFAKNNKAGRYLHFGIREHGMGGIMNGMALHGALRPFGGTFLIFSDYMRPTIRLAALMKQPVIFVYTHDSIGLGEDGPTHQPIEQMATLRTIPGLVVLRPADANEVAESWRIAIERTEGPTVLVFTRQKLVFVDRTTHGDAAGVAKGGYVLAEADGKKPSKKSPKPKVVLMSSGSEVGIAMAARELLAKKKIKARVVSIPSHELFAAQSPKYRESVLPKGVPRIAIEAAHPMSWHRWVGDNGTVIGIEKFGASAPFERIYEEYGITASAVVKAALAAVR
jgi:transketolase